MKKVYFAICCLLFTLSGISQITTTITCTGTTGSYNSGTANSSGVRTDGNIIGLDGASATTVRGWAYFDLSGIPAGSVVNSVTLKFTVYSNNAASGVANEIHGFTGTPSGMTGGTLYTNARNGTSFSTQAWTQNTTNSIALNATGITFITTNLGANCNIGFWRGNGSSLFNIGGYPNTPGAAPQLVINYTPTYKVQFSALNTGAATWCAGETRNISLTVKNIGSATWTSGGTGVNFSYWWSNQNRDFNTRILPFVSVAPNQSQVLTIPVTATTAGTFTLNFDLVKEASCWFGDNMAGCSGPGNAVSTSPNITITALPTASAGGATAAICQSGSTAALGGSFGGSATSAVWSDGGAGGTFVNNTGTTPGTTTYAASATAPASVTLTLTTSGGSCGTTSASKTITVNPKPIVNAGGALAAICQGATTTALGGSFGGGATAAIWSDGGAGGTFANNTGTTPATATYTSSPTAPATVTLTLTTSGGSCGTISAFKTLTINPSPIVNAGGAIAAICQGGTTTALGGSFGGGATGAVWSDGGVGGTFTNNTGSTPGTATYTSSTTSPLTVTLTLTTGGGSCGATADTKIVTVYQSVSVTADPGPASQTVCASFPVTYTVSATGSGLTYQWLKNGSPLSNTSNITGVTTNTLNIAQAQTTDAGAYSVTVSGSSPCSSQTSASATLIVDQKIIITSQPAANSTICEGQPYTISASATGTVATYVWKKAGVFYANAVYDGLNTYSLTIPAVATTDAGSYQLVLDDGTGFGCALANSNPAVLSVNTISVGGTANGSTSICAGTNSGSVTLSGQNGIVSNWESSPDGITWTAIANTTTSLTYTNLSQTTLYRAIVHNGVCPAVSSAPATITVYAIPTTSVAGSNQVICTTTTNTILTANTPVNGTGTWSVTSGPSTSATQFNNVNNPAATFTPAAGAGTYALLWTISNGPCTSSSSTVNVVVNTAPSISSQPGNQSTCAGTLKTFSVTAAGTSVTYQWQYSPDNGVTPFANVTNATPVNITYSGNTGEHLQ